MRARSVLVAVLAGAVVVWLLQRLVLLLPPVAVVIGAVVAGLVLVVFERARDRVTLTGGAVVGLVVAVVSIVQLALVGVPVLAAVYLAGWVVTLLLGAGGATTAVWLGGTVAERGSTDPSTLR